MQQAQEQAALYALGAMPPEEAADFEAHLQRGCEACSRELAGFSGVVDDLALCAGAVRPADSVRATVLERFASPVEETGGVRFVRSGRMPWKPSPHLEIERKPLFADAERRYATQLVRLPAGGVYPAHRHAEVEETYLLEGDLVVNGVTMRAGDYCRAEPGSIHQEISSAGGCVFLVLSSQRDEFLA